LAAARETAKAGGGPTAINRKPFAKNVVDHIRHCRAVQSGPRRNNAIGSSSGAGRAGAHEHMPGGPQGSNKGRPKEAENADPRK